MIFSFKSDGIGLPRLGQEIHNKPAGFNACFQSGKPVFRSVWLDTESMDEIQPGWGERVELQTCGWGFEQAEIILLWKLDHGQPHSRF